MGQNTEQRIRVLVVDDSALMRKTISEIIHSAEDMEVCATARNAEEALRLVAGLRPDVVTLDVAMPGMDGLTCLGYIMSEWPTPVVMVSAYTAQSAETTLQALEFGAVDCVAKPGGREISISMMDAKEEILDKVRTASRVDPKKLNLVLRKKKRPVAKTASPAKVPGVPDLVVAVGASTGGPRALDSLLSRLPAGLPPAVLVVQHMPRSFTGSFAERLNIECPLRVKEAEDGEPVEAGTVYIGKGGHSMRVVADAKGGRATLEIKEGRCRGHHCPSVDEMMASVADFYGASAIGVIMTGMGYDGREGLLAMHERGAVTLAQDEASCIVYGMPKACVDAGCVDRIVSLDALPSVLARLVLEKVDRKRGGSDVK